MNKAIVAGSFDPFTNGHLDLVKKASKIFDEVAVVIAINTKKTRKFDRYKMRDAIDKVLISNRLDNCTCEIVDGPVAVYCAKNNIGYTVRGLRNNMDFNYESEIEKTNKIINESLQTIYIPSGNDAISSTLVRELMYCNLPIDKFVPCEILEVL